MKTMRTMKRTGAFTLVEMMVVIVIIGILAGMVLKLMSLSRSFQQKAACLAILERVSHAINDYRAEYGIYPPVITNACSGFLAGKWGPRTGCAPGCRTCFSFVPPDSEMDANAYNYFKSDPNAATKGLKYGLVSYLISRSAPGRSKRAYKGVFLENNTYKSNVDSAKDDAVKTRWASYLEGLVAGRDDDSGEGIMMSNSSTRVSGSYYVVPMFTFKDPWGCVIRYRSSPPYTSYELWSPGPDLLDGDGSNGSGDTPDKAADNIHKNGKWDE